MINSRQQSITLDVTSTLQGNVTVSEQYNKPLDNASPENGCSEEKVYKTIEAALPQGFLNGYPPTLPLFYHVTNNFRYVFADDSGHYNYLLILLQFPKIVTEYLPLMLADLTLAFIDYYRKSECRQSWCLLLRCIIDVMVLCVPVIFHYTAKLLYWLGYSLTSPYLSYQNNKALHPILGWLSLLSTCTLSLLLGMVIAPLIALQTLPVAISSFLLFSVVGPFLTFTAIKQEEKVANMQALKTGRAYRNTVLPFIRDIQKGQEQKEIIIHAKQNTFTT